MVEKKLDLPAPVLGFVQAMNMYDLDGMVSRFAPDAVANDQMRHYAEREAIRAWLAKEITGDRVTMFVTEILRHPGGVAVLAKVCRIAVRLLLRGLFLYPRFGRRSQSG